MSGDEPSQTFKRQRTAPKTISAALNQALEEVESLVEEGHVNAQAHNQIAKALKRVNDVDASDKNKAVRDAVLKLVAECGFTLGPVMCADLGDLGVFEEKFLRKLFSQRLRIEPKPCTMFTPDWIEEILDFYVPTPSDGETRSDLNMQRDMILTLLYVTPQGVSITNDMLKHLDKHKIAPKVLVNTDLDDDSDEFFETSAWIEELLDCAPEMIQWAAPESDTSEWADGIRAYVDFQPGV